MPRNATTFELNYYANEKGGVLCRQRTEEEVVFLLPFAISAIAFHDAGMTTNRVDLTVVFE